MTTDSFNVLDKVTSEDDAQQFPFNTCVMVDHDNHHRPFPSSGFGTGTGTGIGPTRSRNRCMSTDIYYYGVGVGEEGRGGAGGFQTVQPFDISHAETAITAFKSPGGMMAESLGLHFTNAQWKELERQAMIYKYMMASVPVPPHLLIPAANSRNPLSDPVASYAGGNSGLNLKFTNGADLEPRRCRRTDGKKWRCSRDAAPDQKYCERHMLRGRPRSRKSVEIDAISAKNKKSRHTPAIFNQTVNNNGRGGAASQFVGSLPQPYIHTPVFLDKASNKIEDFDSSLAFASTTFKDSRSLTWMLKREAEAEPASICRADQQWQTDIGLFNNPDYKREAFNLGNFAGEDPQRNHCPLFIDEQNSNTSETSSAAGLLSLGLNSIDEEMGQFPMSLDQNHKYCITPGGSLAEVLQLSSISTVANQSSSLAENGDSDHNLKAIAVSSPSGVLQKTLASFSDSSGNSSPSLSSSVRVKPETDLLWLNPSKLQSSG